MIWYPAGLDLIQMFESEFEDVDALKNALDELFQARVDNHLEWEIMLDMPLPPYVSYCDEEQTELVYELVAQNENQMWNGIKLQS